MATVEQSAPAERSFGPRRMLERSQASIIAIALACGTLASLAWQQGGYFAPAYLHAGAVSFALLAALLLVRPPSFRLSTQARIALGALLAFAVWTWIATSWSATPTPGTENAQRDFAYLAMFGVAVVAAGSGRAATFAVWCSLTVAMVVVVAGLFSRFEPSGTLLPLALDPTQYRLSYPLTYWNAFGALAGMAAVLASGLAADRRTPLGLRSLAAGMSVLAMVAMYLSLSRGAWLAVLAGACVLICASPTRGALSLTMATIGAATTIAILELSTALVDNPQAPPGQVAAGHTYLPKLVALAAAAAAVQAVLARAERSIRSSPTLVVAGRRIKVAVVALALIGAVGVLAFAGITVNGKLDRVGHFVSRQWQDFLRPASAPGRGSARLVTAKTTRGDVYRVALDDFTARPLFGTGAGSFPVSWYERRRYTEDLRNAHSLYLETLAELGLTGLAILLTFLGSCIWAAVRAQMRPTALSRGQTSAVMASASVWIVHAGIDWDWQMSFLTGLALFLIGTVFPLGLRRHAVESSRGGRSSERRKRHGLRARWRHLRRGITSVGRPLARYGVTAYRLAGAVCALAALYGWISAAQAQRVVDANRLGATGRYRAALASARTVSLAPASDEAVVVEAYALQDLGRLRAAAATYARAAAADPGDWTIRFNWALDLAQEHRTAGARAELRVARRLNPLVYVPPALAAAALPRR
ncbi:MAG: O-antigen ligase family protein [Solirubrobacteraceae bacterium]